MVNNCANPVCQAVFKLLDRGDFYALERQTASTEFYRLCPESAAQFELHLDASGGVVPRLRGEEGDAYHPRPEASLRLVPHAMRHKQGSKEGERPVLANSILETTRCSLRLHSF